MKRALLLALVLSSLPLSAHASTGIVVGCQSVKVAHGVSKGITLPCLDNKSHITYQAIRGPVVVNVFGSWCEPCNQEIPHFLDLQALHKVSIVGIDVEETGMQAGRNFVIKKGMSWPILFDTNGATRGTVNKALADFAARGWVKLEPRAVLVTDIERVSKRGR